MAIDGVRLNHCSGKDIVGRSLSNLQFVVLPKSSRCIFRAIHTVAMRLWGLMQAQAERRTVRCPSQS